MKKYLSLILVMALLSSTLCMGVSAERIGTPASATPPATQTVPVKLGLSGEVLHRYSADIEYNSMIFVYNTSNIQWTVGEKSYSYEYVSNNGSWEDSSEDLKIVNHSDLKLGYTVTMANADKYSALNFSLTDATNVLPACNVGTEYGSISGKVGVSVTGNVPVNAEEGDTLGTLTITFNSAI